MSTERRRDPQPASDLDDLLEETSRTFALTIPLLPEPTRHAVTTAYLLFRIADTFEDATTWPVEVRVRALQDFAGLLGGADDATASDLARRWVNAPPLAHAGYVGLLEETPRVVRAFRSLGPSTRGIIAEHVQRTIRGMAGYVERARGATALELTDVEDLRAYCYVVAGIVGEMLTELFLTEHEDLEPIAVYLRERARHFGEGLQLTNILKDAQDDATEGRRYLPAAAPRTQVFALAREDLARASEYVHALQRAGAQRGLVAFTALPVLLAVATLDRVEADGPGAKLTRPEVADLVGQMDRALANGSPVLAHAASQIEPR